MRWAIRSTEEGYEAKWWLDDASAHVVRFQVPENIVKVWCLATRKLSETLRGTSLPPGEAFRDCEFAHSLDLEDERADAILERIAFCKFIFALKQEGLFQKNARSPRGENHAEPLAIITEHTRVFSQGWPYRWIFWHSGITLDVHGDPLEEEIETSRWKYALEKICAQEEFQYMLADLLGHQDLLKEIIRQIACDKPEVASIAQHNYAALLRAILHFLEVAQNQNIGPCTGSPSPTMLRLSQKYRPWLCAMLVENEALPLDERYEYLEKIFSLRLPYVEERSLLLDGVLSDLTEDVREQPENIIAMETLASLMAQHYLSQYALEDAIAIWQQLLLIRKDTMLRVLLSIYQKPKRYLLGISLLILFSFILTKINLGMLALFPAALLLLFSFIIALYGLTTITLRLIRRQGFPYLELFLPRLLGSIIVGLSILTLEDTVWKTTLNMPRINWFFIALSSFVGALAYFFLDVHKSTRLLPPDSANPEMQEQAPKRPMNPIARSAHTTCKIFAIGVLEALGLTILVSSLLPFETIENSKPLMSWFWFKILNNGLLILKIGGDNGLVMSYSPKIVVLWAGLALLIGAFAQLLWQDRQITAS